MSIEVLVLSSLYDFSTDEVVHRLREAGVACARLNREQLAEHRLALDPLGPALTIDGPIGHHVVGEDLRSVFYRQPIFLRNAAGAPLAPAEQLERSQWSAFLRALSVFEDSAWMNFPASTYLAESKPYQLRAARACGMCVPGTTVTNAASAVKDQFADSVAIKSLDTVLLRDGSDSLFTYTSFAEAESLSDDAVAQAPLIAQDALVEKTDLRVTVVGTQVFAVRVLANGSGVVGDWRLTPKANLVYEDVALDEEVAESCIRLMRALRLSFGALDLAETPAGTFFIEVNPTGEWGWLSTPDRPIGAAIAGWLASPTGQSYDR